MVDSPRTYTAFAGARLLASEEMRGMLLKTKTYLDGGGTDAVLIFDDLTGQQIDFDFRGTPAEVVERADPGASRPGPGRPKLGVVSREVTLLPRHWDWLEQQPSGISAALRRVVDEEMKRNPAEERARRAREAASRIMWSMAGDLPNFEEASRALFARDPERFEELIGSWPEDLRTHLLRIVPAADSSQAPSPTP